MYNFNDMKNETCFPAVAVGAVIFHDNKVLLVKRSKAPAKGQWAIPGGKVKPGEEIHQALIREIKEETGLEIKVGEVVYVFDVIEKNRTSEILFHYIIIDYLCEYIGGDLKAGDDALDARFFLADDINKIDINEKTKTLLSKKFKFGKII